NLTNISKRIASNDLGGVKSDLVEAIKLAAFLNIPATAGLIFLRYPIVQVLYERGRFQPEYTIYTGDALLFYSLGLYTYSLVKIVTPVFYALKDTKTPVKYAAYVILAKVCVNLAMIRQLGFSGLALGTSLASLLNIVLLFRALEKRIGKFLDQRLYSTLIRITIASVVMGGSGWGIQFWLSSRFPAMHLIPRVVNLSGSIAGALVVLFISS